MVARSTKHREASGGSVEKLDPFLAGRGWGAPDKVARYSNFLMRGASPEARPSPLGHPAKKTAARRCSPTSEPASSCSFGTTWRAARSSRAHQSSQRPGPTLAMRLLLERCCNLRRPSRGGCHRLQGRARNGQWEVPQNHQRDNCRVAPEGVMADAPVKVGNAVFVLKYEPDHEGGKFAVRPAI